MLEVLPVTDCSGLKLCDPPRSAITSKNARKLNELRAFLREWVEGFDNSSDSALGFVWAAIFFASKIVAYCAGAPTVLACTLLKPWKFPCFLGICDKRFSMIGTTDIVLNFLSAFMSATSQNFVVSGTFSARKSILHILSFKISRQARRNLSAQATEVNWLLFSMFTMSGWPNL
ncbi:hypothetical protein C8N36_10677 [Pelagimonas varians]|uniref:Uncharacterized protein n=1 Tax=Pelagimonas varians TaxID=696760 RepID=A0A238K5S5_9RHOB|nr:hypothetical protein C8N36_10677 [Pelagimonas varians]SMX37827.1 hypothetical protein PEV8663_01213 [Pelagimonas varians]